MNRKFQTVYRSTDTIAVCSCGAFFTIEDMEEMNLHGLDGDCHQWIFVDDIYVEMELR